MIHVLHDEHVLLVDMYACMYYILYSGKIWRTLNLAKLSLEVIGDFCVSGAAIALRYRADSAPHA